MSSELTHEDVRKILELVDGAEHLEEMELVYAGIRLHVRRAGGGGERMAPAMASAPAAVAPAVPVATRAVDPAHTLAPPASPAQSSVPAGMVAVRAPMLGTFYRAPAPGEKPFVEVGQRVKADDTVCLIEVMKLFNSLRAGVDGKVVQVLVENGGLVEYDQALILIEPARKK